MAKQLKLSVCGCALVDHLYPNVSFNAPAVQKFLSKENGDGGLAVGKLVFAEDLEKFSGMNFDAATAEIAGTSHGSEVLNIGGPAIVGAINVSQILYDQNVKVSYYGTSGNDENGEFFRKMTALTDVDMSNCRLVSDATPCTCVFSDPSYHGGKGERTFVNRIGGAQEMVPAALGDTFFEGDVLWFSATALVPGLHDSLTELLRRGRAAGKINVVSTVFDFRNEKKNPGGPWPLGDYHDMDLLIVDYDEALRLAGAGSLEAAVDFFIRSGVSSFFITHGAKLFHAWSDGRFFKKTDGVMDLPVSALVDRDLQEHPELRGDTTGCGDNFAGGIVASVLLQLLHGTKAGAFSVANAAAWGAASGGAACFQIGGTRFEKARGEKKAILQRYVDAYLCDTAKIF